VRAQRETSAEVSTTPRTSCASFQGSRRAYHTPPEEPRRLVRRWARADDCLQPTGLMAILITIMVLERKLAHAVHLADLRPVLPDPDYLSYLHLHRHLLGTTTTTCCRSPSRSPGRSSGPPALLFLAWSLIPPSPRRGSVRTNWPPAPCPLYGGPADHGARSPTHHPDYLLIPPRGPASPLAQGPWGLDVKGKALARDLLACRVALASYPPFASITALISGVDDLGSNPRTGGWTGGETPYSGAVATGRVKIAGITLSAIFPYLAAHCVKKKKRKHSCERGRYTSSPRR